MNKQQSLLLLVVVALLAGVAGYSLAPKLTKVVFGGATGVPASIDDVRPVVVGKLSPVILFRASTSTPNACSSRVISNPAQALLLKFATTEEAVLNNDRKSGPLLSGTVGLPQAASTTVNYDSNVYGCGFVSALGMEASTTIMVGEFK